MRYLNLSPTIPMTVMQVEQLSLRSSDVALRNVKRREQWRERWLGASIRARQDLSPDLPDLRNEQQRDWAADYQLRADFLVADAREKRFYAAVTDALLRSCGPVKPRLKIVAGGRVD